MGINKEKQLIKLLLTERDQKLTTLQTKKNIDKVEVTKNQKSMKKKKVYNVEKKKNQKLTKEQMTIKIAKLERKKDKKHWQSEFKKSMTKENIEKFEKELIATIKEENKNNYDTEKVQNSSYYLDKKNEEKEEKEKEVLMVIIKNIKELLYKEEKECNITKILTYNKNIKIKQIKNSIIPKIIKKNTYLKKKKSFLFFKKKLKKKYIKKSIAHLIIYRSMTNYFLTLILDKKMRFYRSGGSIDSYRWKKKSTNSIIKVQWAFLKKWKNLLRKYEIEKMVIHVRGFNWPLKIFISKIIDPIKENKKKMIECTIALNLLNTFFHSFFKSKEIKEKKLLREIAEKMYRQKIAFSIYKKRSPRIVFNFTRKNHYRNTTNKLKTYTQKTTKGLKKKKRKRKRKRKK